MSNINGLVSSKDVAGTGDVNSNFFIRKDETVVINNLIANQIACNELFLGEGELTTSNDGTTLLLNGIPVNAPSGITTIIGQAPIGVISTDTEATIFLNSSGVIEGSYTNANITVNDKGLITDISSGGGQTLSEVLIAGNSAGSSSINMNNNKITNCLNPTDAQDVATKSYVDSSLPGSDPLNVVLSIGNSAGSSSINMNNNKITSLADATADSDAVNLLQLTTAVADWAKSMANNEVNMDGYRVEFMGDPINPQDATTKQWVLTEIQAAGNVSQWSTYPAIQAVDAGNFTIQNLTDPVNNTDAANKQWVISQIQASENVSQWSTFPAIQDVDIDGYKLNNVSEINNNGDLDITATDINISSTGLSVLDISSSASASLSATLGITVQAGGACNITAGGAVSLTAVGSVNIGSSNVGGTFTSIEKVGINENVIFADGGGPLQLRDIASINDTTPLPNGPVVFGQSTDGNKSSIQLEGNLIVDCANNGNPLIYFINTSTNPNSAPSIVAGGCQTNLNPVSGYFNSSVGFSTLGDFELSDDFDLTGEGTGLAMIRNLVSGGERFIVVGLTSVSGNLIIQGGDGTSAIPSIDLNTTIQVDNIESVSEGVVRIIEPLDVTGSITATGSITGGSVTLTGTEGTNNITNVGTLDTILLKTDVIQLKDTEAQTYIEALDSIQFGPEKQLRFQNDIQIVSEFGGDTILDVPPEPSRVDRVLAYDSNTKKVYYQLPGISIDPTNFTTAFLPSTYYPNTIYKVEPLFNFAPMNLPTAVLNFSLTIKNISETHRLRINDNSGNLVIDTVAGESIFLIYDGVSWVNL